MKAGLILSHARGTGGGDGARLNLVDLSYCCLISPPLRCAVANVNIIYLMQRSALGCCILDHLVCNELSHHTRSAFVRRFLLAWYVHAHALFFLKPGCRRFAVGARRAPCVAACRDPSGNMCTSICVRIFGNKQEGKGLCRSWEQGTHA